MILEQHKVTWFLLHNICVVCLRPLKRLYKIGRYTRVFRPLSSFGNIESLIRHTLKTIFSEQKINSRRSVRIEERSSRAFHPTTDQIKKITFSGQNIKSLRRIKTNDKE